MNSSLDMKVELDTDKKFEQIRQVAKFLNVPGTIEKGMQKLAREEKDLFRQLSHTPISAGHFYELDIIELSHFTIFLGGLAMHLNNEIELPENVIEDLRDHKDEFPDWIDLEDVDNLKANLLAAYYTLNRSLHAINTVGKPINQLLEEGISRNDRGPLKQAVKFDPVAISSPQISSMLMLSELQSNKNLKRDLYNALKSPRKPESVPYAKLRYIVWALHREGLLEGMSEKERYQFLHEELGLYKSKDEDHFDSLNRMIRRWETEFRT